MNEQSIFLAALDLVDPERRAAYLSRVCGDDADLRRRVDELLAAHDRSGDFLRLPVDRADVSSVSQFGPPVLESGGFDVAGEEEETPARFNATAETSIAPPGRRSGYRHDDDDREVGIDLSFLEPSPTAGSRGRLEHYDVRQVVGRGGCGVVLKAFDEKLHRWVAIKVIAPELAGSSPARKRFLREARAAASVRHENVVHVYAVEERPVAYQVMEFVDGSTLQERLDEYGPLEPREVLDLAIQLADGLAAAHERGLIHRDIKPANILQEPESGRVKITDFGLARTADDASLTQSGVIAGTPLYMSPEQAAGQTIDARSDLFSLGSVLYALASGRPPFRAPTTLAVMKRVVEDAPRPIDEIVPDSPPWLAAYVARLHAKNREDRLPTAREAAELARKIRAALERTGRIDPSDETFRSLFTPAYARRAARRAGERPGIARLAAGLAVAVALVAALVSWSRFAAENDRPARPPQSLIAQADVVPSGSVVPSATGEPTERVAVEASGASSPSPVPTGEASPDATGAALPPSDPDRRGAEYVLGIGGAVDVSLGKGPPVKVRSLSELPAGRFKVIVVSIDRQPATDEGLRAFTGCRSVKKLIVRYAPVSERALDAFAECANLEEAIFMGTAIGPDVAPRLAKHRKLARVWLHGAPLGDESITLLKDLPITDLNIGQTRATDATLVAFSRSTTLERLNIRHTRIGDAGLAAIGHRDLIDLRADDTPITDAGIVHFADDARLQDLTLENTSVTDAALAEFRGRTSLQELRLTGTRVTPAMIAELRQALPKCLIEYEPDARAATRPARFVEPDRLAALYVFSLGGAIRLVGESREIRSAEELPPGPFAIREARLSGTSLTDEGMAAFRGCRGIKALHAEGTPLGNAGLACLRDSREIEKFIVFHTRLAPGALVPFERLDRVTHLCLWGTTTGEEDFAVVRNAPLVDLNVGSTNATDAALAALENVRNLRFINVRHSPVSFAGTPRFAECVKLLSLSADGSRLNDAGLARFESARELAVLNVSDTAVTDAGLAPFQGHRGLRKINVRGTKVTPAMVDALARAIPECTIEHDGGLVPGDDPERLAVAYVLSLGGRARISFEDRELKPGDVIPDERFTLVSATLASPDATDAGAAVFKRCATPRSLDLRGTRLSAKFLDELRAALPDCVVAGDGAPMESR